MSASVGLTLVFTLGWIPLYVYRVEGLIEALPAYRPAERFWVCTTPTLLAMHMTAACVMLNRTSPIPSWSIVCGVATFAAAIAFWFWGRVLIGPLRCRRLPDEPPRQLQRDGAFGIVRHPLYLSYLLAAAAPLIVVRPGFLFVTYGPCVVGIAMRALQEERRLRAQLGAPYDAYSREVKCLVPFLW